MASQQALDQMKQVLEGLKGIDRNKLLRPTMGEESLEQAGFAKTLDTIVQKASFAHQYGRDVDESVVNAVTGIFNSLRSILDSQAKRSNAEYVQQKVSIVTQIDNTLQQARQYWTHFVSAAVEARGFLQDEGIRKEYQKTVDEMKAQAEDALKLVREESSKTIGEAKKLADEIEQRARRTAAHISVEEAQKQFKEAQVDLDKQVTLWTVLSLLSVAAFLLVAFYLSRITLPSQWQWQVVYYTAIRITILTAVGAAATFCLRILRAQMHMSHHNRHRQRVANSMQAFVEAAITPEQRDLILAALVNAVVDFGTSGLLSKEDDAIYTPKMTIDSITRTISQAPGKP
jgi:hypothetical protein